MEPFGLLNFLQSLLTSAPQNQPAESTISEPSPSSENPDLTTENETEESNNQAAILSFLDEHDKRAKHIKK